MLEDDLLGYFDDWLQTLELEPWQGELVKRIKSDPMAPWRTTSINTRSGRTLAASIGCARFALAGERIAVVAAGDDLGANVLMGAVEVLRSWSAAHELDIPTYALEILAGAVTSGDQKLGGSTPLD